MYQILINETFIFSSPGLSSASASTFTLKFFKSLYFPNYLIYLVHIWYDDIVLKFYPAIPSPLSQGLGQVKVVDLEILMLRILRAYIFQTVRWILFIFGMMIDTVPKFYSTMISLCL